MSVFDEPSRRNRVGLSFTDRNKSAAVVDTLYDVVLSARKAEGKRGFGKQEQEVRDHIEQVIVDLYSTWQADPALYTGYSRGDANFKKGGCYYGRLKGGIFLTVIQHLAAEGYIKNHDQKAGFAAKSSRMRGTAKLAALIEGKRLSWASISTNPTEDVLILKSEKDDNGNRQELRFDDGDDPRIPSMRKNLEVINKKLESTLINIFVTDEELADINERLRRDPDHLALDLARRKLYRSFVNNSWDEGGRFYGGWWQGVPSEYRKHIQIEGKQTVEWDYSAIHPSILYAQAGLPRPHDSYDIPGWNRDHRDWIKKAFNQLINSSEATKPKGKWRTLAPDVDPDPLPDGWDEMKDHQKTPFRRDAFQMLTGRCYDELLQDIIDHHEPIADVFFTQSWARMQKLDSDIAEVVMVDLYDQDIVVLPIHDSFIVRRGFEGYLKSAMNRAYQLYVAAIPGMKSELDEWIMPEGETGILSGSDMIALIEETKGKYEGFKKRELQWTQSWGGFVGRD